MPVLKNVITSHICFDIINVTKLWKFINFDVDMFVLSHNFNANAFSRQATLAVFHYFVENTPENNGRYSHPMKCK